MGGAGVLAPDGGVDRAVPHGTAHQVTNVVVIVLPFAAALAVSLAWQSLIGWSDATMLVVGYVAPCLGITVGFHRLLTHRAFMGTLGGARLTLVAERRALQEEDARQAAAYFHGLRTRELDLGGPFIRALEATGLAWGVVRVAPARRRAKTVAP